MNSYGFSIVQKHGFYEITDIKKNVNILTKDYTFGKNIHWGKNIKICNFNSEPIDNIVIGDNVFIDHDIAIMVSSFSVMDYTKINNHFYAYGNNSLTIGYNCWLGSSVILDTLGGLKISNNVGIGSQTQIYSHAKFGDVLYGCRINSSTSIFIGEDVWIAPNSTITSASMANKSMLLAGSVLTKSTRGNHIYSGVPAQDITEKTGKQFNQDLDYEKIFDKLNQYLKNFYKVNKEYKLRDTIKIEMGKPKTINSEYSYFLIKERKYIKNNTDSEIAFIKFLLPDKAKFIPY
jgi:acetyltransferase-like isoleucine patch superfamily enzyme